MSPTGNLTHHPRFFSPSSISFLWGAEVFLPPLPVFLESQNEGFSKEFAVTLGWGLSGPCLMLGSGSSGEGFRLL